jgi:hypothetical protein
MIHHGIRVLTTHFLQLWFLLLFAIVAGGLLWSRYGQLPDGVGSGAGEAPRAIPLFRHLDRMDRLSAALFLSFLAFYIFVIFYKEDFAYYDDDMLTEFSVQGRDFLPPIWPQVGRFYPLGQQEFNLLKLVTRSPIGYHSMVVVQLVLLLSILLLALREYQLRYRLLILFTIMIAPSFLIPFTGFVYPERNVLFWLAMLICCLLGYSRNRTPGYFVGSLVSTHFVLYYKETVVLLIVVFAVSQLLLQVRSAVDKKSPAWRELARQNALPFGMLAISAAYVLLFGLIMFPHGNFSYIAAMREPLRSVLLTYLETAWLPWILVVVVFTRIYGWIVSGRTLDLVWEPLALGAIAYFFGVISLRLDSGYYLAPVSLIALLYLARNCRDWLWKPSTASVALVTAALACLVLHDAAFSTFRMVERKETIETKGRLANFLKGYLSTSDSSTVTLFFPKASAVHLMELSSYLKYKGFLLDGQASGSAGPKLAIQGADNYSGERCVNYRDFKCVHAAAPERASLIVFLPDDRVSMSEVKGFSANATLLFSVNSCEFCSGSKFQLLHPISPEFSNTTLPEHWLQLHVFERL